MDNKVRVFLAKKYDLVVGDTFQLFYKSVIEAPNPYCYSIVALCEKGKAFPRYFEYTPQEVGEHKLTISVYNAERKLLGQAETILNVVFPVAPKKPVNILCIGDSITANGLWVSELNRRISSTGGTPEGHGFEGVNFVGTVSKEGVSFETLGDWKNCSSAFANGAIVKAPNIKTVEDEHSLWKDSDGYIWKLDTLQVDYIKLSRYNDHDGPLPKPGFLTHYQGAVHTDPIEIFDSFSFTPNPFYDNDVKAFNFDKYVKTFGVDTIDFVYILLGTNGRMRQVAINNTNHDYCEYLKEKEIKPFIDILKKAFPNVKISILAPQLPSGRGGMGTNYGAQAPLNDYYKAVQYTTELNMAYEELAYEDGYKDFVEHIHMGAQFDSEYNYPHTQKLVNTRSQTTEWLDVDGYHPLPEGRYQIADAVYRNLIKEFKNL